MTTIRHPRGLRAAAMLAAAAMLPALPACVRRTMTFRTVPEGATVRLNDRDIGQTPVTVDFTFYGDYDIEYALPGYETIRTHRRIEAPWYQLPPIDLFAEAFVPFTIHDARVIDEELAPHTAPDTAELVDRAQEFRDRTLYGKD